MAVVVREVNGLPWKYCECCHQWKGFHRCKFCGKKYRSPSGLSDHERICYLKPTWKISECPACHGKSGHWEPVYDGEFYEVDADYIECSVCAEASKRRAENGLPDIEENDGEEG